MTTSDVLILAALVGAIAGALTTFLLSSLRRAFNDWRLNRIRGCRVCRSLRVLPTTIEVGLGSGQSGIIEVDIPCPVCNPRGKVARAKG